MDLLDFILVTELKDKKQVIKAKLLCFYWYKTNSKKTFVMSDIIDYFIDASFNAPNASRIKKSLLDDKIFKVVKGKSKEYEFIPTTLLLLEKDIGGLFMSENIVSNSEILDEVKFNTNRKYITNLIQQINSTYNANCYDACAVMMRRLFEILLILLYRTLSIDHQIMDNNNNYYMLDKIIKDAKINTVLNLSRIKSEFDKIQKIGNYSAHRIEYMASRKDIDDIKIIYRTALEEFFIKIGL